MLYRRLLQSLLLTCLTLTLYGHGQVQAAISLPPEMKGLLQELQKGAGDWLNTPGARDPESGSPSERPQAPEPGSYEDAVVRYQNLLDLVNRMGLEHREEPALKLPLPEPLLPATTLPSPEMPQLDEAGNDTQPSPRAEEDLMGMYTLPATEIQTPQSAERSERLARRLEELAASLVEMLQELRALMQ